MTMVIQKMLNTERRKTIQAREVKGILTIPASRAFR
jgi:hypothetical protein